MLYLWTRNYPQIVGTCPGHPGQIISPKKQGGTPPPLNRQDAQSPFNKILDTNIKAELFEEGDKVLLKRTFGSYPKLSVKWKEDCNGMPYTVVKRIGPVNYAIRNSKGLEKVYHRNLIKSALKRLEPKFIAKSGAQSEIPTDTDNPITLLGHWGTWGTVLGHLGHSSGALGALIWGTWGTWGTRLGHLGHSSGALEEIF